MNIPAALQEEEKEEKAVSSTELPDPPEREVESSLIPAPEPEAESLETHPRPEVENAKIDPEPEAEVIENEGENVAEDQVAEPIEE